METKGIEMGEYKPTGVIVCVGIGKDATVAGSVSYSS